MGKIISYFLIFSFILTSCGVEKTILLKKSFGTFTVNDGTLNITDHILTSIEGENTSDLAFKTGGRIGMVYVRPGELVKKGQVLAELTNQESSIQVDGLGHVEQKLDDLTISTNVVKIGIENLQKNTAILYEKRLDGIDENILLLKNNIEKAKDNLKNQVSTLAGTFLNFAHDYDRVSSNMLYQGDKILGLTTVFQNATVAWEAYLGANAGNTKADSMTKWGKLYSSRGEIRSYLESGATIPNITDAMNILKSAYLDSRQYASSMNYMLQNSVIGGGLSQDMLNSWLNSWSTLSTDEQQSESNFITWENSVINLTNTSNGSGSVAEKDIVSLELDLKNLQISRNALLAEKSAKIQEIQTNVANVQTQKSQISVQIAQTQLSQSLAHASLEYNILRAPFDGIILEKNADIGNVIGSGIPVMKISSVGKHLIKTYIDNDLYRYNIGNSIIMENTLTKETGSGTFTLIQGEKDPLHNKNYVEITLSSKEQGIGDRIDITLSRAKIPLQDGMIIPLESIITRYGPPGVFIIRDGVAVFTLIKLIGSDLSLAEVIGLTKGDVIITQGKENIIDGEKLLSINSGTGE